MFKEFGLQIIALLEGAGQDVGLGEFVEGLKGAVAEAQRLKAPLYLGSAALNVLLGVGEQGGLKKLLALYTVR